MGITHLILAMAFAILVVGLGDGFVRWGRQWLGLDARDPLWFQIAETIRLCQFGLALFTTLSYWTVRLFAKQSLRSVNWGMRVLFAIMGHGVWLWWLALILILILFRYD